MEFFGRLPDWARWILVLPGAAVGYVIGFIVAAILHMFGNEDYPAPPLVSIGAFIAAAAAPRAASFLAPRWKGVTAICTAVLLSGAAIVAVVVLAQRHIDMLIVYIAAGFTIFGAAVGAGMYGDADN